MSSNTTNKSAGGLGFTGSLTIAFIVLKLCGIIDWSWLWVLCPLWAGFAIALSFLTIYFLGGLSLITIDHYFKRKK